MYKKLILLIIPFFVFACGLRGPQPIDYSRLSEQTGRQVLDSDNDGLIDAGKLDLSSKQDTLTNESGLYGALSDVTNFTQPGITETITSPWTFSYQRATAATGALGSIATGDIFRTNAASYDPGGLGAGAGIYRVLKTAAGHVPTIDDLGNTYTKSLPSPAYSHISGGDIAYDDTTGDTHTLTYSETHSGWITNAGATADKIYTIPTYDTTMAFGVMVIAAYQVDIDPPAGDTLFLCISGTCTEGGADVNIRNTSDTPGDVIACKGIEETDGVYELYCFTSNTNWELTP